MSCDRRLKREVVVRKKESAGRRKNYIKKLEMPSQEE